MNSLISRARGPLAITALLGSLALGACSTVPSLQDSGIGFREARFSEVSALRDYRQCRDEAVALDSQARREDAPARYAASARLLEKCEANLAPTATGVARDERMKAYALSIQNHLKSGDVASARANLDRFAKAFPDQDLYYPDGSSFLATMEVLLVLKDANAVGAYSTVNVAAGLKAELRRVQYWKKN